MTFLEAANVFLMNAPAVSSPTVRLPKVGEDGPTDRDFGLPVRDDRLIPEEETVQKCAVCGKLREDHDADQEIRCKSIYAGGGA